MSGIAGFRLSDGRAELEELEGMAQTLRHRGPDAQGTFCWNGTGLAHRMLWTTPESCLEAQPLRLDDLIITADARLDNRPELLAALRLERAGETPPGDAELILHAYREWGQACPERLLGDFAFALLDLQSERLFCARDVLGVRPFYYHDGPRRFAFASEIKALLRLKDVPRRLEELRVAYYLEEVMADEAITFYEGISRLPPAHCLAVDRDGPRLRRYFAFDPERRLGRAPAREYVEQFRALFRETVRCRVRSAYPVASCLSGGLDSSGIVVVARELMNGSPCGPLRTVSTVFDDVPESNERQYIEAVLAANGVQPLFLSGDRLAPFGDWERILWHEDEACYCDDLYLRWATCRLVREQGARTLLCGCGGDDAVGSGYERLAELALRLRLPTLGRELRATGRALGRPVRKVLRSFVWRPVLGHLKGRAPESIRNGWYRTARLLTGRERRLCGIARPEFLHRLGFLERTRELPNHHTWPALDVRGRQHQWLASGLNAYALEHLDKVSAGHGMEHAYPYLDRRLIEFCLALPSEFKLQHGLSRYIVREALEELPPLVRWRGAKTLLSAGIAYGLHKYERGLLEAVVARNINGVGEYVDLEVTRRACERFLAHPRFEDAWRIGKVIGLAMWLGHAGMGQASNRSED